MSGEGILAPMTEADLYHVERALELAMKRLKLTQGGLADVIGCGRVDINRLLNGERLGPMKMSKILEWLTNTPFWTESAQLPAHSIPTRDEQVRAFARLSLKRLNRKMVAQMLSVSESQFDKVIRKHMGPPYRDKEGGHPYWTLAQVEDYIDRCIASQNPDQLSEHRAERAERESQYGEILREEDEQS